MQLVLASHSPRRSALLGQLGLNFSVHAANIDEGIRAGESAVAYVQRMAREKASAVVDQYPEQWVLAADTIGELDGSILVKPVDPAEAQAMLRAMSDRSHTVLTAVCLQRAGEQGVFLSQTEVTFRSLSEAEIRAYCKSGEGLDKAGAYAIQGRAAAFVAAINGCYSTVVGLPLALTATLLQERGFELWQDTSDE